MSSHADSYFAIVWIIILAVAEIVNFLHSYFTPRNKIMHGLEDWNLRERYMEMFYWSLLPFLWFEFLLTMIAMVSW